MTTSPASFANPELVRVVAANLEHVRSRISSTGRDANSLRIVAVTKTFGAEHVLAALAVGLRSVGENYVDELAAKRAAVGDVALAWHYLGTLQSNKIRHVVDVADVICGLSRVTEIDRIAAHRPGQSVYVQVDFTGSARRNGATPRDVAALVEYGRARALDVRGLMTVAPTDRAGARAAFAATNAMCDDLGLVERSMGMSDDLELACERGSSEVRVGRALFGERAVARAR